MPEVSFYLKEPKSQSPTLIFLFFSFDSKRLKYSTGQKILPKFWNPQTGKAREIRGENYAELNVLLKRLDSLITEEYRRLINDGVVPTPEKLKTALDQFLRKRANSSTDKLVQFALAYVESTNKRDNTKKQYRTAIFKIQEYERARKKSLSFDDIDLSFYEDFTGFLTAQNYSLNSIGTVIKNIKVFMNEAVDKGLTKNLEFRHKKFKSAEEESESIYLSENELLRIYEFDFSESPHLDRDRDLFIIGCYTGLRFSDLSQLKKENLIDSGSKVRIKTQKTGELVVIPLHKYVKEIMSKYGGIPPKAISNQRMNDHLKMIGRLVGIDEPVLLHTTKGGKTVAETYKKYELITVHTARRSFATNAYLANVPTISIMKITGHRTERAFLKYIKISQEDNANKLINHPFFS